MIVRFKGYCLNYSNVIFISLSKWGQVRVGDVSSFIQLNISGEINNCQTGTSGASAISPSLVVLKMLGDIACANDVRMIPRRFARDSNVYAVMPKRFLSMPPHVRRLSALPQQCCGHGFNPRPHMGGDCNQIIKGVPQLIFNPRPHMGGDDQPEVKFYKIYVSIHAPTWEATQRGYR